MGYICWNVTQNNEIKTLFTFRLIKALAGEYTIFPLHAKITLVFSIWCLNWEKKIESFNFVFLYIT